MEIPKRLAWKDSFIYPFLFHSSDCSKMKLLIIKVIFHVKWSCSVVSNSVHGIFQARILEWVAISFSRGSSPPRDQSQISCIAGRLLTGWAMKEVQKSESESCSVMYSLRPHGLVHGILQARILEWVAFTLSRGCSQNRDWIQVVCIAGRFFTSWATREA